MTITPHFLAGAAISTATNSYPVAFLLGFLSHFVLDALPHLDPGTFFNVPGNEKKPWPTWIYAFAILEFFTAIIIFFFIFRNRPDFAIISVGGLGGIMTDILDNSPLRFLRKLPGFKQLHWFHELIHYDLAPQKWYWGLPTQIILIGGSIWYLLRF
ncbi:hypothetical protein A2V71_02395 [Candidatus Berkelbacteria bacterium RBG_13_40_8]|uniref:Uncharacterized protein n=1 Tax=Candidatus Berkelbacteria bacterium RBG_13_40_8 TaxID=1797467 RepID=A0A1F5DMY5_9BACT|nr:MAG: hypothetical protein A2V71_02395 [Candidatus Berkelbacteria bacterium RBG_13_40_8]